ncbi:MAG: zinc ribbon domain-containing protein [Promethearchaeota archaeon]
MEVDQQRLTILANKRFSEVLSEGFKLFINNYGYIILPFLIFSIISILLQVFLLTDLEWHLNSLDVSVRELMDNLGDSDGLTDEEYNLLIRYLVLTIVFYLLQNLIAGVGVGGIIPTIAMCTVSMFLYKKYVIGETDFKSSLKSSFNKKIIIVILIIGILMPIGTILFLIPAVIIYSFYIFSLYTYQMKDNDKSISKARNIARGAFWKLIGVFIVNFLIITMVDLIYSSIIDFILELNIDGATISEQRNSWLDPATRNYGMLILYEILYRVAVILFAPLFICLLTSLFATIKAQKDLGYTYTREAYPVSMEYQEPYTQFKVRSAETYEEPPSYGIPLKEGFYCPFCGHFLKIVKKFCPKCGEDISFINE